MNLNVAFVGEIQFGSLWWDRCHSHSEKRSGRIPIHLTKKGWIENQGMPFSGDLSDAIGVVFVTFLQRDLEWNRKPKAQFQSGKLHKKHISKGEKRYEGRMFQCIWPWRKRVRRTVCRSERSGWDWLFFDSLLGVFRLLFLSRWIRVNNSLGDFGRGPNRDVDGER